NRSSIEFTGSDIKSFHTAAFGPGRRLRSADRKEAPARPESDAERTGDRLGETNCFDHGMAGARVSGNSGNNQLSKPGFPRLAFGIITGVGGPSGPGRRSDAGHL